MEGFKFTKWIKGKYGTEKESLYRLRYLGLHTTRANAFTNAGSLFISLSHHSLHLQSDLRMFPSLFACAKIMQDVKKGLTIIMCR